MVIFFGCELFWEADQAVVSGGQTFDYWSFGTLVYSAVILVVSLKVFKSNQITFAVLDYVCFQLLIESRHWTLPFVMWIVFSVFGFVMLTIFYCAFAM